MVEVSYYLLSLYAIGMLVYLLKDPALRKGFVAFLGIWGVYILGLSQTGVLQEFGFPPRVPILIVLPMLAFIIFITSRQSFRETIQNTPLHIPIFMQSFRILVELSIYATFMKGIFPQRATFAGLNFDILVGISALVVGFLAYKKILNPQGIFIWNLISLGVLGLTVFSFISSYYFLGFANTALGGQFVQFPYLLLASLLLPTAVFLHVVSIRQVLLQKRISRA